ncbi:hypothetical protein BOX15_Mlig016990g1 [Macrostomum lignano]|uniref:Amiloride-sensitive sodium channel n=1 Tax=Macrostomum lignano TaxID=282301 RepID=A0A267DWC3_9PLAT|nr:hypothetical protein BOX15_Mlig016990g1 [Macrostomum lignano]
MSKTLAFPKFLVSTFIENTTIRGIKKCYTTKYSALRLLWLLYLISMTVLLGYGTCDLFSEFFEYHKSYQIEKRLNDPTPFPSLTICSMSPFSARALKLWREGRIASPAEFSRQLRRGMGDFLRDGRYKEAASLFHSDKVSTYFQFINESSAKQLAYSFNDLMPFCIMRHSANGNPSVAHEEDCEFQESSSFHHPDFFFCHDLELLQPDSSYVSSLSILLSNAHQNEMLMNDFNLTESDLEDSSSEDYAFNVFNEASGFRIVLHEPGTYPLIDTQSFSVQMQTSTLIKYRPVKVEKQNCPEGECSEASQLPIIQDDDSKYLYTFDACLSSHIGQLITEKCNCTSTYHVRPLASDAQEKAPYCGFYSAEHPMDFIRRLNCVRNLNLSELTNSVSQTECPKRCSFFHYESQLSAADWFLRLWQIHWMSDISSALNALSERPVSRKAVEKLEQLLSFSQLELIATAPQVTRLRRLEKRLSKKMALVTVSRFDYTTQVNRETLQISLSALLSRLGGMGGLTLGVTVTTAFELLELLYLSSKRLLQSCGFTAKQPAAAGAGATEEADENFARALGSLPRSRQNGDFRTAANDIEDAETQLPLLILSKPLPSFYDNCPTECVR